MSASILLAKVATVIVVCAYLGACLLLYIFQARFLFPGAFIPLPPGIEAEGTALGLHSVELEALDGTSLHVLYRAPAPGRPVIVLFHGNASYPEDYRLLYVSWIAEGYGMVAPVARGYPRSSGTPEGEGMLADGLVVYDWIAKTYPDNRVVVFGQSLGTGPAVHVAAHREVAGLVLISPFTSMLALAQEKVPWIPLRPLLSSPFRSDLDAGHIKAPVLIFHGERDTLIPISHARALARLIRSLVTVKVISGAGHADRLFGVAMSEEMASFLAKYSP